ncbi:MAG: transglycosylase SLT domain-containing protein [Saprospiraceae bacterium]|nr:transglycosylase SLT domain-containing protein [Saprospiraceae bacterium]
MKSVILVLNLLFLFNSPLFSNYAPNTNLPGPYAGTDPGTGDNYYSVEKVKERLDEMPCLVSKKFDKAVEGYITGYVVRHRERGERILGKTIQYFPLFEEYLREHDMPEELKYLAVVESALDPKAVSRVGATGLWQFMESTGRNYGLEINDQIDERSDPVKSTLAAIEYLKKQYDRFGSWELALAAYNSGPGRVNRAIRKARSKNFWKLRKYLPRETRNYVPAFIGATYLCLYYEDHGMSPTMPQLDQILTQRIEVYDYLPFDRIAQVTGLALSTIEDLNPAYQLGYIPESQKGNYLELPKRVMPAVVDYLHLKKSNTIPKGVRWEQVLDAPPLNADPNESYFSSIYIVQEGDNMESLLQLFGCSQHALIAWNQPERDFILVPGKELTIYHPYKLLRFEARVEMPVEALPARQNMIPVSPPENPGTILNLPMVRNGKFLVYLTNGGESLRQLSLLYDLSLRELVLLNPKVHPDQVLRANLKLKIEKREG